MDGIKDLIKLCMDGAVLNHPDKGPHVVDFVIPTADGVLIANVGWWSPGITGGSFTSHLTLQSGYEMVKVRDQYYDLTGPTPMSLYSPDETEHRTAAADHRLETELKRYEYTTALEEAADIVEGPEFIDWMAAYLTRPRVTIQSLLQKQMTQLRKTGTIMLVDGNGVAIDALVCDQTGQAATAGIDSWLAGMERVWTDLPPADRPTLLDFVQSLEGQGYADKYLARPGEVEARGTLSQIAITLIA